MGVAFLTFANALVHCARRRWKVVVVGLTSVSMVTANAEYRNNLRQMTEIAKILSLFKEVGVVL